MNIYLSSSYIRAYKRLIKKNPALKETIKDKIRIFKDNPKHHSLKLHKLKGGEHKSWSFSVETDLRIVLSSVSDGVIFADIGKHEDVY